MKSCKYVGLILGFVAAIVYFSMTADYAFPGESARLLASWKGLDSTPIPKFPFMAVMAALLGGGNVIAPLSGAVSVVMLFGLIAAFVGWRVRDEKALEQKDTIVLVAAATAAVVFMFTPCVMSAATHLEPRMFDFAWLLVSFAVAIPFFRGAPGGAALCAPLLGAMAALGFMDSALFVMFLPFYFVLVAMMSVRSKKKPYLPLFLFVFAFLVAAGVALNAFDIDVVEFLRQKATELSEYVTTSGWMFVALFSTLPFLTALFSSGKAFGEKPGLVQWLFHGAMAFVAILAVATPLSPSALMEPYGICPVVTSAFAASVAGYLTAYGWENRKSVVGLVGLGVIGFVLAVNAVWCFFAFDGNIGLFADKVAEKILTDMGDRRWLVTDGSLDSHLSLVADKMGKKVNLISLARDLDKDYLTELGELVKREGVGGSKNGMLQLSLSLGVLPFVQDWFSSDPSVAKEVAIFGAPDLWYSAGLSPVPEFLFFGADESRVPDWSAWKQFDKILEVPEGWGSYASRKESNPVNRMRNSLRRHLGFVANNRGVYLQDKKRDDEAFAMYELVLKEIDRDNICALFNEVAMVGQNHKSAVAKKRELEQMLKTAVDDKERRYLLWRLGTFYGYIRNPDVFVRMGHAWARSGRPGDALRQIHRAIDFVPSDKRTILLNMMAALYASENDQRKSRQIYESVLAKNEKDHDALIGLMRLELLEGNGTKALDYLQRAAATSEGKRGNIELAMAAMMKNDLTGAKELIKKVTDADPKDMQAWSMLAAVTMQQIDAAKGDKAKAVLMKELENSVLPTMEKQARDQFDYYLQATKGFVLLRKGEENRKKAREAFVAAAKARPDIAATQDMVLGLDISLDDKEGAEAHARDVLRRNRNAPLANYVMGSIALNNGKYTEAEAFLRKAADAPQPVVLALNDLAEVLRRNKNLSEAERYARKATEKAPNLYVAWETLGSVLMDANRNLDEAEMAIRKACQLSKDKTGREADVRMLISLARVQLRNGDRTHAKMTVRKVESRIGELSDFERKEFEEIQRGVK